MPAQQGLYRSRADEALGLLKRLLTDAAALIGKGA